MEINLPPIGKALRNEWERAVLLVVLVLGLALLIPGGLKLLSLLRRAPTPSARAPATPDFFGARSWAFCKPVNATELGREHVFLVTPPANWRPPPPSVVPTVVLIKPPPPAPPPPKPNPTVEPPKKTEPPPKPPPPVLQFYVYRGLGKSPEGHALAYVVEEHTQGDQRERAGSHFVKEGEPLGTFVVASFTADSLVLKNPTTNQTSEIVIGDRFQYGSTPGVAKPAGKQPGAEKPAGKQPGAEKPKHLQPQMLKPGAGKPAEARPGRPGGPGAAGDPLGEP